MAEQNQSVPAPRALVFPPLVTMEVVRIEGGLHPSLTIAYRMAGDSPRYEVLRPGDTIAFDNRPPRRLR